MPGFGAVGEYPISALEAGPRVSLASWDPGDCHFVPGQAVPLAQADAPVMTAKAVVTPVTWSRGGGFTDRSRNRPLVQPAKTPMGVKPTGAGPLIS